jgi:hypothetical protein
METMKHEARMNNGSLHLVEQTEDGENVFTLHEQEVSRVKDVLQRWLSCVLDERGVPRNAQQIIDNGGSISIGEETFCRLSLLAILSTGRMSRRRLIVLANRLDKFSREECMYWFSRASYSWYGDVAKRWAIAGMRLMLCGSGDEEETKEIYYKMV